jgi:CRP-like cAMP-binding protein
MFTGNFKDCQEFARVRPTVISRLHEAESIAERKYAANFKTPSVKEYSPLVDLESVISILSRISFLGGVSDAQREEVFKRLEIGMFKKGEYVSHKGETPSHIYVIRKGKIDLMLSGEHGESKKREFNVGDCFGEAAFLSMNNNSASFVAAEDSELIVLSRRALNQLRQQDPAVFSILIMNLARELARKLQYTDEMMLHGEHLAESDTAGKAGGL